MKKHLYFIVSILLFVSTIITACGTSVTEVPTDEEIAIEEPEAEQTEEIVEEEPVEENKYGGVLKVAQMEPVGALAWTGPMGMQDNMVLSFILEPLFYYDMETGDILPYLADSYEMDKENLTLTIKLKEGIYFHDGSELDAENVKWCIEYFRNESSYGTQYLGNVEDVQIIDKYTVKLILSSQNIALLFNLTNRAGTMYSKLAFDTYGEDYIWTNPVGTGPFSMTEWVVDEKIVLEKYENYWNGEVYLDGVEIIMYTESLVAQGAMEAGEIDVIYGSGFDLTATSVLADEGFNVVPYGKSAQLYVIGFNADDEDDPFSDIRVRQAVGHAIDNTEINEVLNYGFGQVTNQWSLEGSPYYNNEVVGYDYDLDKALELMAEAGYEDGFSTRLTFINRANILELATVLQSKLAQIGIELELNRLDVAAFIAMINDWEYGLMLHTATYEPAVTTKFKGMFAQSVLESEALALGKGNFLHPDDLNAAIENAVQSFTPQEEAAYIREAQKLLHDKYCLWIPIYSLTNVSVYADYVRDWDYLYTGVAGEDSAHVWLDNN